MAMMSAYAPTVRMVSMTLSPFVVELAEAEANPRVLPPSSSIAASKLSLVLVDGSKKRVAIFLPSQACAYFARCVMMSSAVAMSPSISAVVRSEMSMRCLSFFISKPVFYLSFLRFQPRFCADVFIC